MIEEDDDGEEALDIKPPPVVNKKHKRHHKKHKNRKEEKKKARHRSRSPMRDYRGVINFCLTLVVVDKITFNATIWSQHWDEIVCMGDNKSIFIVVILHIEAANLCFYMKPK